MSSGFQEELRRYGPSSAFVPQDLAHARRYCARLARSHYENFTVASALLPRRLLRHFHAVYAYCRWADDLADEVGGGSHALQLLRWWRGELLSCYEGRPTHPVMIALRETIRRFSIPPAPFLDLLFAFEQDQIVKRYETHEQLVGYCRNSANPVGRLVLYLCESFGEANAVLSDHVCTALQLANFWQDVARDFAIGRVYLPKEDRLRFGYTEADLQNRRTTPAFRDLLRFEVDQTKDLFYRGWPLLDRIDAEIRPDIELFIRGGLGILRKIEKVNYDVWTKRPELAKWEKVALLGGVLWNRVQRSFLPGPVGRNEASGFARVSQHANGSSESA
jgi:squalene synthase HpnC